MVKCYFIIIIMLVVSTEQGSVNRARASWQSACLQSVNRTSLQLLGLASSQSIWLGLASSQSIGLGLGLASGQSIRLGLASSQSIVSQRLVNRLEKIVFHYNYIVITFTW